MPTNASILADYASGIGTQGTALTIDGDNQSVGIGTTLPTSTLDVNGDVNVTGVITATSFYGDGSNLTGIDTDNALYSETAGIATYASTAGIATVAQNLTGNPSISVTDITATGNVSIAGTLTYEDVTNVDSIGIVTARSGVHFGLAGVGGSVSSAGNATFAGIVTATDFNSTSDEILKENITTVENAVDLNNQLRGVRFEWKKDSKPSYGVIAQELEQVLPELVSDTDPKTVNYNGIIGVLIEAVKELSARVDELENR